MINVSSEYTTISISRKLFLKLKERAVEEGFGSVSKLIEFYMRLVLRGELD